MMSCNLYKTEKMLKAHPIMIMHFLSRYIFLLIIPSLKSIASFFATGSIAGNSLWYLFFMVLIVIISILKLFRCRLYFMNNYVKTNQGIFLLKENIIKVDNIASIASYSGIILHSLKAVSIRIDTQSGKRRKSDFEIVISKNDYNYIINTVFGKTKVSREILFTPEKICIMALSATSVITGASLMFSVINYASKITEENIADKLYEGINNTASLLDFVLPRAIGIIAATAAAGFIFSFSYTLFKYSNFYVSRNIEKNSPFIYITCGLLSKKEIRIKENFIAAAFVIHRPLMSLLHHDITKIHAAGFAKGKSESSILLPASSKDETKSFLKELLPQMQYTSPSIKPPCGTEHKFIFFQLMCLLLLVISAGILSFFSGIYSEDLFFILLILLAIIVIWLVSGYFSSKNSGINFENSGNTVSFRTAKHSCDIIAIVRKSSISFIKITQSPFEIKSGLCSVKLYIYSGKKVNFRLKSLSYCEIVKLLC